MATYQATVLADSPAAFFLLGETAGTYADSSTNGFAGTDNGSNTRGVATNFSGSPKGVKLNGFVSVPSAAPLNIVGDVSCEFILAITNAPPSFAYIASKGFDGVNGGYGFYFDSGASATFKVAIVGVGGAWQSGYIMPLDGVARHYICTRSGNNWVLYENSVQKAASANATGTAVASTALWEIGAGVDPASGAHQFAANTATVSAVSLYNTALSPARVIAHYQALVGPAAAAIKKSPPPSVVARVGKRPHPVQGGSKGQPPAPSPLPEFGHLDGERRKREDQ